MSASITFYGVVLSVHIMAVVIAFGFLFAYPVLMPWARRAHPGAMPVFHEMAGRLSRTVMSPAMVVVLLAGVYLASKADAWSEVWVSVPLLILLVIGGLSGAYLAPRERRLAELAREGVGEGSAYAALFQQVAVVAYANCALVLIAIFFMAAKP